MSISNQKWILFNSREVTELVSILTGRDNTSKLLALEILANTNKRFQKRDARLMMGIIRQHTKDLLSLVDIYEDKKNSWPHLTQMNLIIGGQIKTVTYSTRGYMWGPLEFSKDMDKEKFPDQAYAFELIEKVKFLHKEGFGRTEQDKNKYKKREYKRSAKNHYS